MSVVAEKPHGAHRGAAERPPRQAGRLPLREIGSYEGQTAVAEATRGRYRASIEADGSWMLRFEQPLPQGNAKRIPATIRGGGAKVVPIRSDEDLRPLVTGRHRGQANFIVHAIGYGDVEGTLFLFNEIGPYKGETLADEMPAANYLLYVQADGPWTIRFAR
jgi:hypothetical protein